MEQTATARRTRADTKQRLLEAAERLFAEHGIEAVSLRQITLAAGQKNESALHYHFGSREALIEAIFEWRMSAIDARRNAMLDALAAEGAEDELRALIAAIVHPLSAPIRMRAQQAGEANCYNRFLAAAQRSPNVAVSQFVDGKYDSGVQRAFAWMRGLLAELPERLLRQRYVVMLSAVVYGVADIEQAMAQRQEQGRSFDVERAIENLIDMAAAAMAAPVSPATRARLERDGDSDGDSDSDSDSATPTTRRQGADIP